MGSKNINMIEKSVYNLEFPIGVQSLSICGYIFNAVPNYNEVYKLMPNYSLTNITGSHQITAIVNIPEREEKARLPFENKSLTKLYDILIFLSLLIGRNIFVKDWKDELPIVADYRQHTIAGGQLRLSVPFVQKYKNTETGELLENPNGIPIENLEFILQGLDTTIEKIITHISTKEWFEKYDDGYFLFTYKNMVQWQNIESCFVSAWTIWESLFSIENRKWMSEQDIYNAKAELKIAYILQKYFGISLGSKSRQNVRLLVNARNRIVHFGKMSDKIKIPEMKTFIQATDQIVAAILGLKPNNALNSLEYIKKIIEEGYVERH